MDTVIITAGEYKGRKISTPGGDTHPMGSRERLALFNMLTGEIENASILDAFAGSGALGIEALSRGAKEVFFVEKNSKACDVIRKNLESLGIKENFKVIKSSISEADLGEFDIVLADPPYDNFDSKEVDSLTKYIKHGGTLVLSHPDEAPELRGFTLLKTHQYAAAHLSIYYKD